MRPAVADAVVDLFRAEFRAGTDREEESRIDGEFLVLHGAMGSEPLQGVEGGEVPRRVRGVKRRSNAPM